MSLAPAAHYPSLGAVRAQRYAFVLPKHPLTLDGSPAERLRLMVLWVMMVGSALVMADPSPYEVAAVPTIGLFLLTGGLSMHRALMALVLLLTLYCAGLTLSATQVWSEGRIATWVIISWYLGVTAVFFAALVLHNTEQRLQWLLNGWIWGAIIAALTGTLGYLGLIPGADLFLRYGRAKGTFNDPNVFGPFLVMPALMVLQTVLTGSGKLKYFFSLGALGLFIVALLLSFSRAAWAHFAISAALMAVLMFITAHSNFERMKLTLIVAVGLFALVMALIGLLQLPKIADLMSQRASLNQGYDMGPMGRFGRHELGWTMVYDHPFGYGPGQFAKFFPEDAHNVYLNSFFSGGWIAGIFYFVLTMITLIVGCLSVFRRAPWQKVQIATVATFIGLSIEGRIIDLEHWRHLYVLMGMVWGLALAGLMVRPLRADEL